MTSLKLIATAALAAACIVSTGCKACDAKRSCAKSSCCSKNAGGAVWVLCRFDLKPEVSRAEYIEKTKSILAAVRAEKGCCEYRLLGDAATDWDKPQRFGERTLWMLEKWESVAALQAHLQTPHMKAFGPTVRPMRSASTFHVLEDVTE